MIAVDRLWKYAVIGAVVLGGLAVVAFMLLRAQGHADIADGQVVVQLDVKSSGFANEGSIPRRLSCRADGLSPAVEFSVLPPGTKSMAIVMDDTDSPFGFVHWLVYNIPSQTQTIAEGASSQKTLPSGASEGLSSDEIARYSAPCPPGGNAHRYVIRAYALSIGTALMPGLTKKQLADAVKGHVIAEGQWSGFFGFKDN